MCEYDEESLGRSNESNDWTSPKLHHWDGPSQRFYNWFHDPKGKHRNSQGIVVTPMNIMNIMNINIKYLFLYMNAL